eukprot:9501246-Alexandrium_andersonii.AAC.1
MWLPIVRAFLHLRRAAVASPGLSGRGIPVCPRVALASKPSPAVEPRKLPCSKDSSSGPSNT